MEITINQKEIENRIFTFRGNQVMIDRDLAEIYSVDTKVLNQAVKRNIERFPGVFRFQLSDNEKNELVTNCDRFVVSCLSEGSCELVVACDLTSAHSRAESLNMKSVGKRSLFRFTAWLRALV